MIFNNSHTLEPTDLIWSLLFCFTLGACTQQTEPNDEEKIPPQTETVFSLGVDLSYVNQIEDHGGAYYANGNKADPFHELKLAGANTVRVRLWHNPEWVHDLYENNSETYGGLNDVIKTIQRAKNEGFKVNLDIHYSDTWADPSHQNPPKAWENITNIDILCDSVYQYTHNILTQLHEMNLMPEMVQIGNEINCGLMHTNTQTNFPKLSVCDGYWENFGRVINSGIQAVRNVDQIHGHTSQIALHIADPKNLNWWFTNIHTQAHITDYDIAGFSYYHIWHTSIPFKTIGDEIVRCIANTNKAVMILETAYPFTTLSNDTYNNMYGNQDPISGYEYSIEGQKQYMTDLCQMVANAGGQGVMYWEPAWITSNMQTLWGTGSSWENCTFFNFDGEIHDGVEYLNIDYLQYN